MRESFWQKVKEEIPRWRTVTVPGIVVIALAIAVRLSGSLQLLEWMLLDNFLRLRPSEPRDERIVIVGIDEDDIQKAGTYPIPDLEIANLIQELQRYKPRAIGLDNIRDLPVEPGRAELAKVFRESKNLIGIAKVLPPYPIKPSSALPPERVGFGDVLPDKDGQFRRSLLGTPTEEGYQFSLSLRLANIYLAAEGISLENGIQDKDTMRFDQIEIPRFLPDSGGYIRTDGGGSQTLLNYRNNQQSFRILSLNDIKTGNFDPAWIRDRLLLIGITASSIPDFTNTSAIDGLPLQGHIYGVEFQAHAISQIISAVLDGRPLLKTWSDEVEYLWIVIWGLLGVALSGLSSLPWKNLVGLGTLCFILVATSYWLIFWGWWIPVVPTFLVLVINGIGLTAFSQYDRYLRLQIEIRQKGIEIRQKAIDEAFTDIHNGPLQDLFLVLRSLQKPDVSQEKLLTELQKINYDIRARFDLLKQEALSQEESLHLGSGVKLDLKSPIQQLFSEISKSTIQRDLPNFQSRKGKIPLIADFKSLESQHLTIEQKKELCQFLEEVLCNIGKHARGTTRIFATASEQDGWYTLSVRDNGMGLNSSIEGRGTKQLKNLAKRLRGTFKRETFESGGTLCELSWPVAGKNWRIKQIKEFFKIG